MSDFIEENKKMIILAGVLLVLYIVFGIINSLGKGKTTPQKALKELGTIYYEELVYPYIMESDEKLAKEIIDDYKENGLEVHLNILLNSIEGSKKSIFYNDKTKCDNDKTYIIIYPTGYKKNEYKIEVNASC